MLDKKKSPRKSLWFIKPGFFGPPLSTVEEEAHARGEQRRHRRLAETIKGYSKFWQAKDGLIADININLLASISLTGEPQDDTEIEAIIPVPNRKTKPLRQQDLPIHLRDTQPLTDPGWLGLPLPIKLKIRREA